MEKKKKNNDAIVWGIILVVVLFFAYNFGLALTDNHDAMIAMGMSEEEIKNTKLTDYAPNVISYFEKELTIVSLNKLIWNEYIKKSMLLFGFVWFMIVATIYSDQKNLITNKEYGTARWGKDSDVRNLFASNIMMKELEQVKKCKKKSGMMKAKKEARKESKMYANEFKKQELMNLDLWFETELSFIINGDLNHK